MNRAIVSARGSLGAKARKVIFADAQMGAVYYGVANCTKTCGAGLSAAGNYVASMRHGIGAILTAGGLFSADYLKSAATNVVAKWQLEEYEYPYVGWRKDDDFRILHLSQNKWAEGAWANRSTLTYT